ncbi:MAG: nitrite reductase large subunit NirB [Pirellulaceae bacterium]
MNEGKKKNVVVIGNGMVGHRFIHKMVEFDQQKKHRIVSFCEEPLAAYNRVGLTSFFAHRDVEKLMIARLDWYQEQGIELHIGDRASKIDRRQRVITSELGSSIQYDVVVLATGSYPFVPPVDGIQKKGVFVYRTIADLDKIIEYSQDSRRCAIIGGGLLGLEAAKAAYDMGLETHVVEFASRLMPRQVDDGGSHVLVRKIKELGIQVHLNKVTEEVTGNGCVNGMVFSDGEKLPVDMIIVSAGIRPRDELARACQLEVGERGGVCINDYLQTSDPDIYAIGEVALHDDMIYGLVAPGYQMAEVLAHNLCGPVAKDRKFTGSDQSTKLKMLGVDVASFGDYEASYDQSQPLVFEDPFAGIYKKLLFDREGQHLLGGILVGDASTYGKLSMLAKRGDLLSCSPQELLGLTAGGTSAADTLSDDDQVCSCHDVDRGTICQAIREQELTSVGEVKSCTSAGTGCGGCLPMVADLLDMEMKATGVEINRHLCEHLPYSRQEILEIIKIKEIKTFDVLMASHGTGDGCEICKPAVTSILASLWNEMISDPDHHTLQDTNDRFLANMQRGGLYSVVPRVPGGEITPDKLIVLGRVAKKYGLYTKITGGQRVDLFGAQLHQLPDIWEELIEAGFESGHAYGKAVRTVKSCVGTTWCRYGVQDSVSFAIRIEQRYRGIRAPHKIKFAVSGCVRECAEAQGKDVGLIATDNGYNLYVCGNGGTKPRHADLLVSDIDEAYAIRIIDRFLMYYIFTADKLNRTATWLEKLPGGIEYLREVVINDKLGLAEELERRMQHLVDTYQCEWNEVVKDPEKRKRYRQFVNTDETVADIELIDERGQSRPVDWPRDDRAPGEISLPVTEVFNIQTTKPPQRGHDSTDNTQLAKAKSRPADTGRLRKQWVRVGQVSDFPRNGGAAIKFGQVQIAVYNFTSRGEWYACQNMCPHKNAFVLSRGIVGSVDGEPKLTCPLHKTAFSLKSGKSISGDEFCVKVFPVKVVENEVFLELPPQEQLDALLATDLHCVADPGGVRTTACSGSV